MVVYGAILLSILFVLALAIFFKKETTTLEYAIPFVASIIFVVIAKVCIDHSNLETKEYWGSMIQRVEYYEPWNEYITQTCTRSCCCDSKGENCGTETYDCSYVKYHDPEWIIVTTTNEHVEITKEEYERLKPFYGNEVFKELHRDYYTMDGDEYHVTWLGDSLKAKPVVTLHYYENKVKVADQSIFHYPKVDSTKIKQYHLFSYPKIQGFYYKHALLGDETSDGVVADLKLRYINGLLGRKKEVHALVLVFVNQPIEAAFYQEGLWQGGNMNEFITCIGIDSTRKVQWCKVISWTPAERLKVDVETFVEKQDKLDLQPICYYLQVELDKQFIRKDFKEFNYLTIEPSTTAIILVYLGTLIINILCSFWIISNEFTPKEFFRKWN